MRPIGMMSQKSKNNYLKEPLAVHHAENERRTWLRLCINLAFFAAVIVTFMDVALLQRKFNFFTGGFLSVHHLKSPIEAVEFIGISLISDLGITYPLAALTLWLSSLIHFNRLASAITMLIVSVGPAIAANVISYRIIEYLGDIFDYQLAFEIAGRDITEIMAVASGHLFFPVFLLSGSVFIIIILVIKTNGYWRRPVPAILPLRKLGVFSIIFFLFAVLVTSFASIDSESFENGLQKKPTARLFSLISETVTDIDGDGYGLLHRPKDPDPFNSRIFPYAIDIPANGIDENGVAGDLLSGEEQFLTDSKKTGNWKARPNIIFFILESFRADLIGKTYKGKQITPELNGLAHKGISSDLAFTHIGFTAPSRYHLFSGRLFYDSSKPTLIDDFKSNGYEVAYFSAQDVSFGGKLFDIGFDRAEISYDARVEPHRRYTTYTSAGSIALPYEVIIEKISDFLKTRQTDRPLFMIVDLQDTHFPYHHSKIRPILNQTALSRSEISPRNKDDLWSTYVNTAANVDLAVARILEAAKNYINEQAPGIIVTADHGESLYDDSFLGHGFVLNDIQTRVPLIVVDLPIVIEQPFGHAQLREAITRALSRAPEKERSPVLKENPQTAVFQYLGNIKRPSQIALRGIKGSTIYDFRTGRIQILGKPWRLPSELDGEDYAVFRDLVSLWERIVLKWRA